MARVSPSKRPTSQWAWLRIITWFVVGCAIPLALFWFMRGDEKPEPQMTGTAELALAAAVEVPKTRITYPAGHPAHIALPDGSQVAVKSILNVPHRMRFGSYVWDEEGIAAGPITVRIDLNKQLLSVFRGGHEIGSAVILFGTDGKPTPIGSFKVKAKDADYHSRTYDAPMPFMMMLTDDGVAIHGSEVRNGSATHGCIGVPLEFARLLFDQAKLGDEVSIMGLGVSGGKPQAS